MRRSWKEAFRGKLPLFLLLGGLLAVTAVAGILVAGRQDNTEEQGGQLADLNEPAEEEEISAPAQELNVDAEPETEAATKAPETQPETEAATREDEPVQVTPQTPELSFSEESKLNWPIRGNVVLDYSMDKTIYFPTLDVYKCNPGVVIQAEIGSQVKSPAAAMVQEVATNEEIGTYVVLELGNDYYATIGQLDNVQVKAGQYVDVDSVIGFVAEPTKYYVVEGSNIYLELEKEDTTLDPMDYMN